jgi:hypothetical protein
MQIAVADFSETPAGRYSGDGPHSGELFRENVLRPALMRLAQNEVLHVKIDNVEGYGSSFLEEAFGGLVRDGTFTPDELIMKLAIDFDDPSFAVYRNRILSYISSATHN